jgi:hypothetical protein
MSDFKPGGRPDPDIDADVEHPRGTLAIVIVFGALFALGFFVMYGWVFLARGATH